LFLLAITGCKPLADTDSAAPSTPEPQAATNAIELVLPYGSEKESWLKEATAAFLAKKPVTASGNPIRIRLMPMGSGDCIDEVLSCRLQAHLISPASMAFVEMANYQARISGAEPLFTTTETLIVSPVVIAMWDPMARKLGWPGNPLGWSDLLAVAQQPDGWGHYGSGEWGRFKLGHTHPGYSNSGLLSVLAEIYSATGKTAGLTFEDLEAPATAKKLSDIERCIVHYGTSTGFFAKRITAGGPSYMSAAVLYESNVIEANLERARTNNPPLVAIYPREGTFWSDHPIGVVNRSWVTAEHRDAASRYIKFLLDTPQQKRAMDFGFRPSRTDIPLGAPLVTDNGVTPSEPRTTLQVPKPELLQAAINLWGRSKKASNVLLLLDISGSMGQDDAIGLAKQGARDLLGTLSERDSFGLMLFNNVVHEVLPTRKLDGEARRLADEALGRASAGGGTAIYDALAAAMDRAQQAPADEIAAIVLLSDGSDTNSKITYEQLIPRIAFDPERNPVRIFTIGYGKQAPEVLKQIASQTQAKSYTGDRETVRKVFRDIATFF
jgi:Ca-activated chloride channel family protein